MVDQNELGEGTPNNKPNKEDLLQNIVPQAGILNNEENPTTGAGFTDFGGSQKHEVANPASAEGVDRLVPTAFQKTSEEEEDNQASAEASSLSSVKIKGEVSGGFHIRQKEPLYATEEHGQGPSTEH